MQLLSESTDRQTDRQTDRSENITSFLAEVISCLNCCVCWKTRVEWRPATLGSFSHHYTVRSGKWRRVRPVTVAVAVELLNYFRGTSYWSRQRFNGWHKFSCWCLTVAANWSRSVMLSVFFCVRGAIAIMCSTIDCFELQFCSHNVYCRLTASNYLFAKKSEVLESPYKLCKWSPCPCPCKSKPCSCPGPCGLCPCKFCPSLMCSYC